MKYVLDVNALLACEHRGSPHHATFHAWARREGLQNMATCAHSELGFIRVSMQAFSYTLAEAQDALAGMKHHLGGYIAEAPSPRLPDWADNASRTSDAYLVQQARSARLELATFDAAIPDVHLIRKPRP